jgi:hypothetical protein
LPETSAALVTTQELLVYAPFIKTARAGELINRGLPSKDTEYEGPEVEPPQERLEISEPETILTPAQIKRERETLYCRCFIFWRKI